MGEKRSVVVVDDELISRGYMEMFIKSSKTYDVVAALSFAKDAISWCEQNPVPDLIVMDVMMADGIDGLTAAGQMKKIYPDMKIIIATSMADADWIDKAKEARIDGFWFKTYSNISLLEVLDRVSRGEVVYPADPPAVSLGELPADKLTGQQREVLRYLGEGLTNREIAEKMYLSPNTIKDYLDELMEKTGIHSRVAMVAQVARLGIA
ncbi:MAG: response regulator transcription factor, partial [Lachnospiraceae bacterium]|nr:response regulator transcription factor [Lachnospiraceae bacterium]